MVNEERLGFARRHQRALLILATSMCALVGCTQTPPSAPPSATTGSAPATMMNETTSPDTATTTAGAQPTIASDPAQLADDLVADEQALRDPATPPTALDAAARRQQAAYRAIGRHDEGDPITRSRIPPSLLEVYDRNIDARRQLAAMTQPKGTVPQWR